jgi:phage terminase large subunit-like protein
MSGGKISVCGTRYHNLDIYNALINDLHYKTLILPAIKEDGTALCEWLVPLKDRVNEDGSIDEGLETIRENLGSVIWQLQYMNDASILNDDAIIKPDYIQYYNDIEWKDNKLYVINNGISIKIGKIIMGVDPAISEKSTADDSAFVVCGMGSDNNIYILESINKKLSFDKQINMVEHLVERCRGGLKIRDIQPGRDKIARTMSVTGFFEDHRVYLQKSMQDLIDQLIIFPDHIHDDLVDAVTYGLLSMKKQSVEPISISL